MEDNHILVQLTKQAEAAEAAAARSSEEGRRLRAAIAILKGESQAQLPIQVAPPLPATFVVLDTRCNCAAAVRLFPCVVHGTPVCNCGHTIRLIACPAHGTPPQDVPGQWPMVPLPPSPLLPPQPYPFSPLHPPQFTWPLWVGDPIVSPLQVTCSGGTS